MDGFEKNEAYEREEIFSKAGKMIIT